ncbi:hypothetical protein [Streptomyces sp. MUSC 14]|uniref:hypothetical protein n=1 Tax=Streptomyces sp. MUSC 14 TaxID=1354889 RepID=UPI003528887A
MLDADDDGRVSAYCVGGLVLDVPAASLPDLVEWTLTGARLGQPRLHRSGKDADPLVVLTESACVRYGLPPKLSDEERLAGRIPDTHKAVRQLLKADWLLTRRGFGPWAWVYRPAEGSRGHTSTSACRPGTRWAAATGAARPTCPQRSSPTSSARTPRACSARAVPRPRRAWS